MTDTPMRRFRCPDKWWIPAVEKANEEGTTMSAKLRGWIIEDLRKGQDTTHRESA